MTDELATYQTYRRAWLALVAPRMAARITDAETGDAVISLAWGLMQDDYKAAVWALLDEPTRERVRRVRAAA